MPAPRATPGAGATDHEICRYLLARQVKQQKDEKIYQATLDDTSVVIIGMAFSIYVAYIVQRFYENIVGYLMWGEPCCSTSKVSTAEVFWTRLIWFVLVCVIYPVVFKCIKYDASGSRKRLFHEDVKGLWRASTKTMVLWAYKDLAMSMEYMLLAHFVPDDSSEVAMGISNPYPGLESNYWFNTYSAHSMNQIGWYLLAVILSIIIVISVSICLWLGLYYAKLNVRHGVAKYIQVLWLDSPPFLLGIGMILAHFFSMPWYFFPIKWVGEGTSLAVYGFSVRTVCAVLATCVNVKLVSWHITHTKRRAAPVGFLQVLKNTSLDLLIKSLPFAYAVQWTQCSYELFFHAVFGCGYPFGCNLRLWVLYSALSSCMAIFLVPVVKAAGQVLRKLDHVYAYTLLQQDKGVMREQATSNELFCTLFSIGVGWGYTKTAAAECSTNYTATCPDEINGATTLYYAITVVCYILLASFLHHNFMAGFRFRWRADKVSLIEEGRADELFAEVDKDSDGVITQTELDAFLQQSGLDQEMFQIAFNNLSGKHGAAVPTKDLLHEFMNVMDEHRERIKSKIAKHKPPNAPERASNDRENDREKVSMPKSLEDKVIHDKKQDLDGIELESAIVDETKAPDMGPKLDFKGRPGWSSIVTS